MAKYKVLVVDDDELVRGMLEDWLYSAGYIVATASDGDSGLAAIARHRPDVVITDLSTPAMDGFEFCLRVRKTSDIPVLVFSGVGEKQALKESMELRADSRKTKNNGMTEFLKLVKRLATNGRKQARSQARSSAAA